MVEDANKTLKLDYHGLQRLGRYSLLSQLGQGGMGIVYKAYDNRLERTVALKVLSSPQITPEAIQRFEIEAKANARLHHPHIVTLYDFEHDGSSYFFTMELIEGCSLEQLLATKNLSLTDACQMMIPILDAIGYAHEEGIIHRDIKPNNILVNKRGEPVVSDFGLAKILEGTSHISNRGKILGTPGYMSPEQIQGDPLDRRSDIFALGALFYKMLTGKPCYQGDTPIAVLYQVLSHPIPNLREVNPDIPPTLEKICIKALAQDKNDRYQNTEEMAKALRHFLKASGNMPEKAAKSKPISGRIHIRQTKNKPRHSNRIPAFIWVIWVITMAIGIGIYFVRSSQPIHQKTAPLSTPIAEPKSTQRVPPSIEPNVWQTCWNVEKGWFDFTETIWENLPHDKQVAYASLYQIWYTKYKKISLDHSLVNAGLSFDMILIPPGKFWMGSKPDDPDSCPREHPRHKVVISKPFYFGKYEISQAQWYTVTGARPWLTSFARPVRDNPRYAVTCVRWEEVQQVFLPALGGNFMLPTEAEWEYACRAGTTARFFWGEDPQSQQVTKYAWYDGNTLKAGTNDAQLIGLKKANPWGLFDICGNAYEWCMDTDAPYSTAELTDFCCLSASPFRIIRGGGWCDGTLACRSAYRNQERAVERVNCGIGLRLKMPVDVK